MTVGHGCGPVGAVLQVYRYCQRVNALLADPGKPVVHVCGVSPHKRANAALLACCYGVVCRGLSAEQAFQPFLGTLTCTQQPCVTQSSRIAQRECVHTAVVGVIVAVPLRVGTWQRNWGHYTAVFVPKRARARMLRACQRCWQLAFLAGSDRAETGYNSLHHIVRRAVPPSPCLSLVQIRGWAILCHFGTRRLGCARTR